MWVPIADGGEGTAEALVSGLHGTYQAVIVSDPLGREISASYDILPNRTAVIEMAAASGLPLLFPTERNPLHTTTYGFGQLIRDAVERGCRNLILGIGGSATNDGGVGFGLMSYLHAELKSGIDLIIHETGLADAIQAADLVITGEGCLDAQTVMGKAPVGIAKIAKQYGKPVIAFSGAVGDGAKQCNAAGIDAFFPILRSVGTLEAAMDAENAAKNLADTAEQVFRLIGTFQNKEEKPDCIRVKTR